MVGGNTSDYHTGTHSDTNNLCFYQTLNSVEFEFCTAAGANVYRPQSAPSYTDTPAEPANSALEMGVNLSTGDPELDDGDLKSYGISMTPLLETNHSGGLGKPGDTNAPTDCEVSDPNM